MESVVKGGYGDFQVTINPPALHSSLERAGEPLFPFSFLKKELFYFLPMHVFALKVVSPVTLLSSFYFPGST